MNMNSISQTAIICGMARDCARELSRNIHTIESIAVRFADYRIVVLENNSKDNTKQVLCEWANKNQKVYVSINEFDESSYSQIPVPEGYFPFFSQSRIQKYADYRNKLLDIVDNSDFENDYLIMIDMDVARIDVDGFFSSFQTNFEWDAMTANGYSRSVLLRRRYHDTYALCEIGKQYLKLDFKTIVENREKFASLRKGMPFVKVLSAYGGIAIFKAKSVKGLRYYVIPNNYGGVQVRCEHSSLFFQMANHGNGKIYINPNMEVLYQRINIKSIINYLRNLKYRMRIQISRF